MTFSGTSAANKMHKENSKYEKGYGDERRRQAACFASGTMVLTAAGNRAIELIGSGDLVFAYDPHAGKLVSRRVFERKSHKATRIWEVHTDSGATILTTPKHPFLSAQGWTTAEELQPGDVITINAAS